MDASAVLLDHKFFINYVSPKKISVTDFKIKRKMLLCIFQDTFEICDDVLVIFQGPHGYISSSWYGH